MIANILSCMVWWTSMVVDVLLSGVTPSDGVNSPTVLGRYSFHSDISESKIFILYIIASFYLRFLMQNICIVYYTECCRKGVLTLPKHCFMYYCTCWSWECKKALGCFFVLLIIFFLPQVNEMLHVYPRSDSFVFRREHYVMFLNYF